VLAIYRQAQPLVRASARRLVGPDLESFHLKLFMHKVEYNLRGRVDRALSRKLRDVRLSAERSRMKIEDWFSHREMKAREFVKAFNNETILFQDAAAGVLKAAQYKALFGARPRRGRDTGGSKDRQEGIQRQMTEKLWIRHYEAVTSGRVYHA